MKFFFFNLLFFTFFNNFSFSQNIYSELANEIKNSEELYDFLLNNQLQSVCSELIYFEKFTSPPHNYEMFYSIFFDSLYSNYPESEKQKIFINKVIDVQFNEKDTILNIIEINSIGKFDYRCGLIGFFSNQIDNKIFCEIYCLPARVFNQYINDNDKIKITPYLHIVFIFEIENNSIIKKWSF